jgi:hypothetical protein
MTGRVMSAPSRFLAALGMTSEETGECLNCISEHPVFEPIGLESTPLSNQEGSCWTAETMP